MTDTYVPQRDHICGSADNRQYLAGRVAGASHIRSQKPCQDAYAIVHSVVNEQSVTLMAVADGHGSDKYDLSQHGSRIAVATAVDILKDMCRDFAEFPQELDRVFRNDFPRLVVRRWGEGIANDARTRGIVTDESAPDLQALTTRYGTTLLVAVVTDRCLYVGQLGDGDVLMIDHAGAVEPLFPPSDQMIGNTTYSLSQSEAYRYWVTTNRILPNKSFALLLSTDGLSNCFETDDSFHQFASSLHVHIHKEGTAQFGKSLAPLLSSCSEKGSYDDVTIAFLHHENKEEPSPSTKGSDTYAADRTEG